MAIFTVKLPGSIYIYIYTVHYIPKVFFSGFPGDTTGYLVTYQRRWSGVPAHEVSGELSGNEEVDLEKVATGSGKPCVLRSEVPLFPTFFWVDG